MVCFSFWFSHSSRGCSSLFLPPHFPPSAINARKCGQPLHRSQLLVGRCRQDMPCYDRNTHKRQSCQKVQTILAGFGFFCLCFVCTAVRSSNGFYCCSVFHPTASRMAVIDGVRRRVFAACLYSIRSHLRPSHSTHSGTNVTCDQLVGGVFFFCVQFFPLFV